MKIAVIGAGVIGATSAYYLARDGHEVTRTAPHGNELRQCRRNLAGYAAPRTAPGVPLKVIRWLFQEYAPFAMRFSVNPAMLT